MSTTKDKLDSLRSVKAKLDSLLTTKRVFVPYMGPIFAEPCVEISTDGKVCRATLIPGVPMVPGGVWDKATEGSLLRLWPGKADSLVWYRVDCIKIGKYAYWWADFDYEKHGKNDGGWEVFLPTYCPTAHEAVYAR